MANTFSVVVHEYPGASPSQVTQAYELAYPYAPTTAPSDTPKNAIVFIGGLYDGPHMVPYIRTVAEKLHEETRLSYSVFEIRMDSSYTGWGYSSLARDVKDIDALVKYLRSLGKERIVLFGHSTGCQDCMEYSNYEKHQNTPVDGFILQGSVSDREGLAPHMGEAKFNESLAFAEQTLKEGKGSEYMPESLLPEEHYRVAPITVYRWRSLTAKGGDDDYFSSDLPDETVASIWGRLRQPVLVVPSAEDQYAPKDVDFEKLVARWKSFGKPGIVSDLSALIPKADHRVEAPESRAWLAGRVAKFLESLQK